MSLALYTYWRSSSAYRVRIALALKGLNYEPRIVNLLRDEQHASDYLAINPEGTVPVLTQDGQVFTQSLAIIEYLDETHPDPPLLPQPAPARAFVRALAAAIACDVHPLNNRRVLLYLENVLRLDEGARQRWVGHWVSQNFQALERRLAAYTEKGRCSHGDAPTLADICLVPQMYNARRWKCDLSAFPVLRAIDEYCAALPAFRAAAPENQPDAA